MERQEAKRLEQSRLDAQTRQEIQAQLQALSTRIQEVKKRLHAHIEPHETLKQGVYVGALAARDCCTVGGAMAGSAGR